MIEESALFSVRGGGIVIKQKSDWDWRMDLRNPIPKLNEPTDRMRLSICRKSAVMGILAYKMGEKVSIEQLAENGGKKYQIIKKMADRALFKPIKAPFISNMFFRKDRGNGSKKLVLVDLPLNNLNGLGYKHADPSVQVFWEPLVKISGSTNLSEINRILSESLKEEKRNEAKEGKINSGYYKEILNRASDSIKFVHSIPKNKMGLKIRNWLESVTGYVRSKLEDPQAKLKRPKYSGFMFDLVNSVAEMLKVNEPYLEKFNSLGNRYSKFSCITDPDQMRHWVNNSIVTKYYSSGSPGSLVKCDFNILIPDISSEEKDLILSGPVYASWPSKGIVKTEICMGISTDGYSKHAPSVGIADLLRGGIKVKNSSFEFKGNL